MDTIDFSAVPVCIRELSSITGNHDLIEPAMRANELSEQKIKTLEKELSEIKDPKLMTVMIEAVNKSIDSILYIWEISLAVSDEDDYKSEQMLKPCIDLIDLDFEKLKNLYKAKNMLESMGDKL